MTVTPIDRVLDGARRYDLGVLFVHGIGTQRARNTLVQWGDELVRVIRDATDSEVLIGVERARPGDGTSGQPAESELTLESKDGSERWLLTEAWWADAFPPPTYGELVSWSVRAVPWSLCVGIAHRYNKTRAVKSARRQLGAGLLAYGQLAMALAFAPFFVLILALMLLLGLLPIPQLRSMILSAQSMLTGAIGDSLAFVDSPHRHGLIRTRIVETIERLRERCDRTVVVAHSQGAAVAVDAIDLLATEASAGGETNVPDALLTFGSGVNQLASLRALSNKAGDITPLITGVATALVALFIGGQMLFSVRAGTLEPIKLLHAAGVALAAFVSTGIAGTIAVALKDRSEKVAMAVGAVGVIATIAGMEIYGRVQDLPMAPTYFMIMAVIMLAVSLHTILSEEFLDVITARLLEPAGLSKWIDLYASDDPVPNGPTRLYKPPKETNPTRRSVLETTEIYNRGSLLSDHTCYWQNLDGFVLRVARLCAEVAHSPWVAALPPSSGLPDLRAAWRVRLLKLPRRIIAAMWLSVFFILWSRGVENLWLPYRFPTWLPALLQGALQVTELLLLIVVAAWANRWLLELPWKSWTGNEQSMFIRSSARDPAESTPSGIPLLPTFFMGTATGVSFLAFYSATQRSIAELQARFGSWDDLFALLAMPAGFGIIFALLTIWLRKDGPVYNVGTEPELDRLRVAAMTAGTPPGGVDVPTSV